MLHPTGRIEYVGIDGIRKALDEGCEVFVGPDAQVDKLGDRPEKAFKAKKKVDKIRQALVSGKPVR